MGAETERRWLRADSEQGVLRVSIAVIVAFAVLGVAFGLLSSSTPRAG